MSSFSALVPCGLPLSVIRALTRVPPRVPQLAQGCAWEPVLPMRAERPSGPIVLAVLPAAHRRLRRTEQAAAAAAPVQAPWAPGAAAWPAPSVRSEPPRRWAAQAGLRPRTLATGRQHPAGNPPAPCTRDARSAHARSQGCGSRAHCRKQGALQACVAPSITPASSSFISGEKLVHRISRALISEAMSASTWLDLTSHLMSCFPCHRSPRCE